MINKIKTQLAVLAGAMILFADKTFAAGWNGQDLTNVPDLPGSKNIQSTFISGEAAGNKVMASVKYVINRGLGLLAFIAIVILIRAGFKMLFNASDDGEQKKAMGVVKNVAIALIFIGVSWLIVSGIFWFIGIVTA